MLPQPPKVFVRLSQSDPPSLREQGPPRPAIIRPACAMPAPSPLEASYPHHERKAQSRGPKMLTCSLARCTQ
jgi:hypothetical protein